MRKWIVPGFTCYEEFLFSAISLWCSHQKSMEMRQLFMRWKWKGDCYPSPPIHSYFTCSTCAPAVVPGGVLGACGMQSEHRWAQVSCGINVELQGASHAHGASQSPLELYQPMLICIFIQRGATLLGSQAFVQGKISFKNSNPPINQSSYFGNNQSDTVLRRQNHDGPSWHSGGGSSC